MVFSLPKRLLLLVPPVRTYVERNRSIARQRAVLATTVRRLTADLQGSPEAVGAIDLGKSAETLAGLMDAMRTSHADSIREATTVAERVQGWLYPQAGQALYILSRCFAPIPTVVELGSWRGRSTIWLALGLRDRGEGRVYSVDTWAGTPDEDVHARMLSEYGPNDLYDEFKSNIEAAGVTALVTPIRARTDLASRDWPLDRQIGLLLVDAGHSYDDVRRDFELWSPFVAPGGFIVFDDVPGWPGPTRLVSQLPGWFHHVGVSQNQWIVQRSH